VTGFESKSISYFAKPSFVRVWWPTIYDWCILYLYKMLYSWVIGLMIYNYNYIGVVY